MIQLKTQLAFNNLFMQKATHAFGLAQNRKAQPYSKKNRILMIANQFYPIVGGYEQQCQRLSKELIERGWKVRVVTGWWNRKVPKSEIIGGVPVYRNHTLWRMFGFQRGSGLVYMFTLLLYLLRFRKQYDIIHIHQVMQSAFIGVLAGKIFKKPTIAKAGSSGTSSDAILLKNQFFGKAMFRFIKKYLNVLVATSIQGVHDFLAAGFNPNRIRCIPNGIKVPEQSKKCYVSKKIPELITVTHLTRVKGVDILLQAFGKVRQGILHILGDGPLKQELQILAQKQGITNRVIFHGHVSDVADRLLQTDIFVLPSRAEGMSNAMLEAMAAGLPCIATSVGGNIDLLAPELLAESNSVKIPCSHFVIGSTGILINSEDAEGLAKAIEYLFSDESLRKQLGEASRKRVILEYSIKSVAKRYIEIYNKLG